MVAEEILDDPAYSSWVAGLAEDPEPDTQLQDLDVILNDEDKREVSRQASLHLKHMEHLELDGWRKLWRVKQDGTTERYIEALRASDMALHLAMIDLDDLGDDLYA